jgi:PAS domain-containing protein
LPDLIVFAASALFISWLNGEQKGANADLTQEKRDRKKAEEALRASEQRLQDIVDNTTAVIFVKDLELHYLLVNREFERPHPVQHDQIRGKTDFELQPACPLLFLGGGRDQPDPISDSGMRRVRTTGTCL